MLHAITSSGTRETGRHCQLGENIMRNLISILALAFLPAAAAAAERPDWAFPSPPPTPPVVFAPDDGKPKQVPGSTRAYTQKEIDAPMAAPDWFPNEHPPMPKVVVNGNGSTVRACISCHLSTGHGHPENSRLPGSTASYLARQLAEFRSGARKGGEAMIGFSKNMTDDEIRDATNYFAALPVLRWTRVVETDTVPKTYFRGNRRMPHPDGGTEPIGNRIIEVPEDAVRVMLRDPTSGFVSYAPPGSVAKGQLLVATGGNGKTVACTICHGPTLKGIADVPGIANQSPMNIARQLYLFQTGERAGAWAPLMKPVVEKLNAEDIVNISAYVASLEP
jgi:cytochrome c553